MLVRTLACALCLAAPVAFAAPIAVSNTQAITASGQLFNFNFAGLATSGTGGQFSITLNGDYSGFSSEASSVTVDLAGGSLRLGDFSLPNGITSNTVAGLTLASYVSTVFSFDDVEQSWVFNISNALLGTMLADGVLGATVQNDSGVNPFAASNPDFVRVGFSFDSATVPEPATLALAGLALVGMGAARRFRSSKRA